MLTRIPPFWSGPTSLRLPDKGISLTIGMKAVERETASRDPTQYPGSQPLDRGKNHREMVANATLLFESFGVKYLAGYGVNFPADRHP